MAYIKAKFERKFAIFGICTCNFFPEIWENQFKWCWKRILSLSAIDCDRNEELCSSHDVVAYPTMILFKNNEEIQRYFMNHNLIRKKDVDCTVTENALFRYPTLGSRSLIALRIAILQYLNDFGNVKNPCFSDCWEWDQQSGRCFIKHENNPCFTLSQGSKSLVRIIWIYQSYC